MTLYISSRQPQLDQGSWAKRFQDSQVLDSLQFEMPEKFLLQNVSFAFYIFEELL